MKNAHEVAVFWDYENCPAPTNTSGYAIVNNIRSVAQSFGSVTLFKAYLEISEHVPVSRAAVLRSELQSSGVSLTDCPHNGRKDVADKMILVDMLAHAIDNPAPSTIVLISGDRDFAYALSILKLRRYRVVLITLSNAHPSLRAQASLCFDWISDVLEPVDPVLSHQRTSPRHGKTSLPPVQDKFYSVPKDHNLSRSPFQESHDEKSASCVEFMNYVQDEAGRRDISRTHGAKHYCMPHDLEPFTRQPVASDHLRNGPEPCATAIRSPIASSCQTNLNGSIETPFTMTTPDPNPPKPPNTSAEGTPNLATYGSITPSARSTLRESVSLPNLVQHEVPSVTEPVSTVLPAEPALREFSPLSQQGPHPPINTKTQSPSGLDQLNDGGGDLPSHPDIFQPPKATSPLSAFAPSFMLPSSLGNATVSATAESSVKAANPPQPTSFPVVPDKFKILIQCLKSHRSKGRLRPLRSNIAVEISHNGATYRQAGVLKFGQYVAMAEKAGIVELGGSESTAFIALRSPWYDVSLS